MDSPPRYGELSKIFPVMAVVAIIFFLYLDYVFVHCGRLFQLDLPAQYRRADEFMRAQLEFTVFHIFTMLMLGCFIACIHTAPGRIPDDASWDLQMDSDPADGIEGSAASLFEKKHTGERRHCKWCLKYKPDRCHHCRVCNDCVLRMDHHCPWVYNCIGLKNHKYFFLLLVYALVDLVIITFTMFDSVWWSTRVDVSICVMIVLLAGEVLATFLMVVLTCFLGFHVWLMLRAMTTVEFCEKALKKQGYDTSVYSLGCYGNICAVLGPQPLLWLLPLSLPVGDGLSWQRAPESERRISLVDSRMSAAAIEAASAGHVKEVAALMSAGSAKAKAGVPPRGEDDDSKKVSSNGEAEVEALMSAGSAKARAGVPPSGEDDDSKDASSNTEAEVEALMSAGSAKARAGVPPRGEDDAKQGCFEQQGGGGA